jgi:hypothetical protein
MVDTRDTELVLKLVDGTLIQGKTNIRNYSRLSDLLNSESDPFLILYEAILAGNEKSTIFVNKDQILWVKPEP